MTIDEVLAKVKAAGRGQAVAVAQECIPKLSEDDQLVAGGDIEEMAILVDEMDS